ncbi:metallophosphoesterase [Curtobacterium sp. MCLR17_058]|uniref:metallophosphoesterase family protein n=1 Tax=Curtobacterium sp. MCLR17_058 TaxID=2175635 RepID=UPI0015E8DEB5|nr:metallophosphoesterase [Curtobacterium sp. MCLR17_058]WIB42670.1 metallophosphoesterase [Curtobacterium sp. MCLR17_058]
MEDDRTTQLAPSATHRTYGDALHDILRLAGDRSPRSREAHTPSRPGQRQVLRSLQSDHADLGREREMTLRGRSVISLTSAERDVWPTPDGQAGSQWSDPTDRRIALLGDVESHIWALRRRFRQIADVSPDVRTIVQLGDLRYSSPTRVGKKVWRRGAELVAEVDAMCRTTGVDRFLLVPGNHDWPQRLAQEFSAHPERPFRLGERVWTMPRGFRFNLADVRCMSFGGAASVARSTFRPDWHPSELPSEDEYRAAAAGPPVDVLFTHEAVDAGVPSVEDAIASPAPKGTEAFEIEQSRWSRSWTTWLARSVQAKRVFHGHMHVYGHGRLSDTQRVISLAPNYARYGGGGLLDLRTLEFTLMPDQSEYSDTDFDV